MGWMQKLVSTYDNVAKQNAFTDSDNPLAEVGFIDKKAEVMVTLNRDGTFRSAERLPKDADNIINIPTTAEAESRTSSKLPAFPLFDQLVYLSGTGYSGKDAALHIAYEQSLRAWAEQPDAPEVLKIFHSYIAKGTLLKDLRLSGFKVDAEKDAKQLYCFRIIMEDGTNERIWQREDVRASWRKRSMELQGNQNLCYVEGQELPIPASHPKFAGNGKLISAKDDGTIFQYKGRFTQANEAVQVSYDASLKVINTLKWLLSRQGFNRYGMQAVSWSDSGGNLRLPIEDDGDVEDEDESATPQTFKEFGEKIRNALKGRRLELEGLRKDALEQVNILALVAATPGRISVTYYQELDISDYTDRLMNWYTGCSWGFTRFYGPKDNRKLWRGISTPTPAEIAKAVYGKRQADIARSDITFSKSATKVMRQLKIRLLHCMVDGAKLPKDLLMSAFHRVSAPQGFCDDSGKWQPFEWDLALSTYCAMLRKQQIENNERVMDVELDTSCTERSYLYGRLLAVVDAAERDALGRENYRETNAFRYMQIFRQRPFDTWAKLHSLALPYFAKLGSYSERYKRIIGEITALFEPGDFESSQPLDGRFLQGYYCQRQAMYTKKDDKQAADAIQPDNN